MKRTTRWWWELKSFKSNKKVRSLNKTLTAMVSPFHAALESFVAIYWRRSRIEIWSSGNDRRLLVSPRLFRSDHKLSIGISAESSNMWDPCSRAPYRRSIDVCRTDFTSSYRSPFASFCVHIDQIFSEKSSRSSINYAAASVCIAAWDCKRNFLLQQVQHRFHFSPYQFLFSFFLLIHFYQRKKQKKVVAAFLSFFSFETFTKSLNRCSHSSSNCGTVKTIIV